MANSKDPIPVYQCKYLTKVGYVDGVPKRTCRVGGQCPGDVKRDDEGYTVCVKWKGEN